MSKTSTLPWFKMPPAIILHPKFQKLSIEAQAGYMTLCAAYWQDEGILKREDAEDYCDAVDELIIKGYLLEAEDSHLDIEFLQEQLEEQDRVRQKRVEAGRKGGKARAKRVLSKSQATTKQVLESAKATVKQNQAEKIRGNNIRGNEKRKREERADAQDVIFPWETDSFFSIWQTWCKFRTSELRKQRYKPIGEQAALKKLTELSGGDEMTAHKIIEQSIANGWQGLFELKNQKSKPQTNGKPFEDLTPESFYDTVREHVEQKQRDGAIG